MAFHPSITDQEGSGGEGGASVAYQEELGVCTCVSIVRKQLPFKRSNEEFGLSDPTLRLSVSLASQVVSDCTANTDCRVEA